jgi:hypothetical protein
MSRLALVMQHVGAGHKIRMYTDVYGAWSAEIKTGWLFQRTVSVDLELPEVEKIKDALRRRRHARENAA